MVVQEVTRWRREVERFTPERLEEFEAGIHHALEHPAPLQRPAGPVAGSAGLRLPVGRSRTVRRTGGR